MFTAITALCATLLLVTAGCGRSPIEARADALLPELAQLGYDIDLDGVDVRVATEGELGAALARLAGVRSLQTESRLFQALGVKVRGTTDEYIRERTASLESSVSGLLDTRRRTILLRSWVAARTNPMSDQVIAHEMIHVSQHARRLLNGTDRARSYDEELVHTCLTEGEADVVALDLVLRRHGRSLRAMSPDALWPNDRYRAPPHGGLVYTVGSHYLMANAADLPWPEVTARAYAAPPSSTEQILHPAEKHGRDEPTAVTFVDPAGADEHDETIGELGLYYALLRARLASQWAEIVVAGWDGDRLRIHEDPDGSFWLVWVTVWDRPTDANQFASAMRRCPGEVTVLNDSVVRYAYSSVGGEIPPTPAEWSSLPPASDGESTAAVEAALHRAYASRPRLVDDATGEEFAEPTTYEHGTWRHDELGLGMAIPDGWQYVSHQWPAMEATNGRGNVDVMRTLHLGPLDRGGLRDAVADAWQEHGELVTIEEIRIAGRDAVLTELRGGVRPAYVASFLVDPWLVNVEIYLYGKGDGPDARRAKAEAVLACITFD